MADAGCRLFDVHDMIVETGCGFYESRSRISLEISKNIVGKRCFLMQAVTLTFYRAISLVS